MSETKPTAEGLWWGCWGASLPKVWCVYALATGRLVVIHGESLQMPVEDEKWEWMGRVLQPGESGRLIDKAEAAVRELDDALATIRRLRSEAEANRATIQDLRHELRQLKGAPPQRAITDFGPNTEF